MFHFHSCVLWGRTKGTRPIRRRSCKPTRGIRQWCNAGVRLQGSEDVPMQWGKFFSGFCLRSIVTARRQRFGKITGEVRTDLDTLDRDVFKTWTMYVSSTTSTGDTTNSYRQKQWQWLRELKPRKILGNAVEKSASDTIIFFTFCWPCISVYLSQYLTNFMHKICFTINFISCLYMFRAHVLIITAPGIITPIGVIIQKAL